MKLPDIGGFIGWFQPTGAGIQQRKEKQGVIKRMVCIFQRMVRLVCREDGKTVSF